MNDRTSQQRKGGIKGDVGRAERLAEELRTNLVRRKARARKAAATVAERSRPPKPGDDEQT